MTTRVPALCPFPEASGPRLGFGHALRTLAVYLGLIGAGSVGVLRLADWLQRTHRLGEHPQWVVIAALVLAQLIASVLTLVWLRARAGTLWSQAALPGYDFVVLDAPPSFGLLNLNALIAANDLIIPVLADFLSYDGLRLLFETVQGLETDLSHQLEHIFIVVNAFNQTFRIAREALDALKTHYAEYLLESVVRQCTKFAQASSEGCPVFGYDPDSKGANDIEALQVEILGRIGAMERTRSGAGGA